MARHGRSSITTGWLPSGTSSKAVGDRKYEFDARTADEGYHYSTKLLPLVLASTIDVPRGRTLRISRGSIVAEGSAGENIESR